MTKILYVYVAIFTLFLQSCATIESVVRKPEYDFSSIKKVAVLDFNDSTGNAGSGTLVSELFEKNLLKAGYSIIDRNELRKFLNSKNLSQEIFLSKNSVIDMKNKAGVDAVITGIITKAIPEQYQYHAEMTSFVAAQAELTCQLISTQTNEVLWSGTSSYDAMNLQTAFEYMTGSIIKRMVSDTHLIKK
jgi:PBP1b-binding outer membrane lipoprotein LpoB